MTEAFAREEPVNVYNFGLGGHEVLTFPFMMELIGGIEEPRLYVYIVTPFTFNYRTKFMRQRARQVSRSPYGKALLDDVRWRGKVHRFTLDHWRLVSMAPALRKWIVEWKYPAEELPGFYSPLGFHPFGAEEVHRDLIDGLLTDLSRFRSDRSLENALREAVEMARAQGAEVLLAEAPLRPDMRDTMTRPGGTYLDFRGLVEGLAAELDIQVAFLPLDDEDYAREDFVDGLHLTPEKAAYYARWLARQIAARYPELHENP